MAKANSFEAEIDEILDRHTVATIQSANASDDGLPENNDAEFRRQILSMVRKQLYGIDSMPATMEEARFYIGDYHAQENYPNLRLHLTDDFFQALKNSRSDGDESM